MLIQWLKMIPAGFWGVLAGSFFTLLGIWFTNRAQAQRLERQLDHERLLKSQERELALKRDVYLSAAEAVSAGLALVGRLPDLVPSQDKLFEDWNARLPAIARANLVASDETLEALTLFYASLSSKVLSLLGVRFRLVMKAAQAQFVMDEVNRLTSENGNLVALLQQLGSDPADTARREVLRGNFDAGQVRVRTLLTEHAGLANELLEDKLRFSRVCNQAGAELAELVIPLLASARAELELPFDAEAYARIVKNGQTSSAQDLETLFGELRSITRETSPDA